MLNYHPDYTARMSMLAERNKNQKEQTTQQSTSEKLLKPKESEDTNDG